MSHRRIHLLEKLQVEVAAALAALGVYFLLAPWLGADDPGFPVTFVPQGEYGRLLLLAGTVWVVAAACAAVTVSARPEGAILSALIGAAGISLYSPPIRVLLWSRQDDLAGVFAQLRLEMLLLSVVLVGVVVIVTLIRRGVARLRPGWLWKSPLPPEAGNSKGKDPPRRRAEDSAASGRRRSQAPRGVRVLRWLGLVPEPPNRKAQSRRDIVTKSASFCALALLISMAALLLLMRSPQRGQILFALLVSFVIGVLIAHQVFPAPVGIVAWLLPVAAAVILYTLAEYSSVAGDPRSWMAVPDYSRALPTDWLTAGCGGAVLGYWISERLYEARHLESQDESEEGA